ncbi:hypothetical protein EDC04DRAFT_2903829 [Pisolithus marmoratus]|nr:hypothetical protein EDC04DRAFT_2903829 [Pisolithus marmoratus]
MTSHKKYSQAFPPLALTTSTTVATTTCSTNYTPFHTTRPSNFIAYNIAGF